MCEKVNGSNWNPWAIRRVRWHIRYTTRLVVAKSGDEWIKRLSLHATRYYAWSIANGVCATNSQSLGGAHTCSLISLSCTHSRTRARSAPAAPLPRTGRVSRMLRVQPGWLDPCFLPWALLVSSVGTHTQRIVIINFWLCALFQKNSN